MYYGTPLMSIIDCLKTIMKSRKIKFFSFFPAKLSIQEANYPCRHGCFAKYRGFRLTFPSRTIILYMYTGALGNFLSRFFRKYP